MSWLIDGIHVVCVHELLVLLFDVSMVFDQSKVSNFEFWDMWKANVEKINHRQQDPDFRSSRCCLCFVFSFFSCINSSQSSVYNKKKLKLTTVLGVCVEWWEYPTSASNLFSLQLFFMFFGSSHPISINMLLGNNFHHLKLCCCSWIVRRALRERWNN